MESNNSDCAKKELFKNWFNSYYTTMSITVIFLLISFIVSFFFKPFWGNNIYPEEAYLLLERVAKDTINIQEKNVNILTIPQNVKYTTTHKNTITVYDNLQITCNVHSDAEKITVEYVLPSYGGIFNELLPSYTVQLDKDFNIIATYRDTNYNKFQITYWLFRIVGSFLSALFIFVISVVIIIIYWAISDSIKDRKNKVTT